MPVVFPGSSFFSSSLIGLEKRMGKIGKKINRPIIAKNKLTLNKTYKPMRRRVIQVINNMFKAKPCHINGLSNGDRPFCIAQKIITILEIKIRIKPIIILFNFGSIKTSSAPRPGFEPGTFSLQEPLSYLKAWTIS